MKKVLFLLGGIVIIISLGISLYVYNDHKYYDLKIKNKHSTTKGNDIGIIGDSWVIKNKLDNSIKNNMKGKINVKSKGYYGFKSKELLQKSNSKEILNILEDKKINKVVLIAGVNDTAGHIGKDYYSYHMVEWVKLINSYGKKAYILEVPEYGIEEKETFKSGLKHNLYRFIFDNGQTNVIHSYRNQLNKDLNKNHNLDYKLIDFDNFISDYHNNKNLYKDQYHLNNKGNTELGKHIAKFLE